MNTIVCIKQVPDTSSQLKIAPDKKDILREGISYIITPYDEYAIEEALLIKEKFGGKITVISLGPDRVTDALRSSLSLGCDEAIHLKDACPSIIDPLVVAKVLAEVIAKLPFDLILCGKQAVDDDSSQVGPAIAGLLNIPQATLAVKIEFSVDSKILTVHREIESRLEVVEIPLPCVITCQKGLNEPRYASLPGIVAAKKKEIKVIELTKLPNFDKLQNSIELVELSQPPERKPGRILEGSVAQQVKELVRLLREEARVI